MWLSERRCWRLSRPFSRGPSKGTGHKVIHSYPHFPQASYEQRRTSGECCRIIQEVEFIDLVIAVTYKLLPKRLRTETSNVREVED